MVGKKISSGMREWWSSSARLARANHEEAITKMRHEGVRLRPGRIHQNDYKRCMSCGFDHGTQATQAYNGHMDLIAESVRKICVVYANSISNVRVSALSGKAVYKQVQEAIRSSNATVGPEAVYDKVVGALKDEGYKIREK